MFENLRPNAALHKVLSSQPGAWEERIEKKKLRTTQVYQLMT
jgi:hypothetical protein